MQKKVMIMDRKTIKFIYLGAVMAAAAAIFAWRKSCQPDAGLPFSSWQKALARQIGKVEAARLLAETSVRYAALLQTAPRQSPAALRRQQDEKMLPLLALYQALRGCYSQEKALALAEIAQRDASWVEMQPIKLIRLFPGLFPLFKWGNKLIIKSDYPPQRWTLEWRDSSPDIIAFDVQRCFLLETLQAQGAPELTPIFCQVDDWMMENLPPSIRWERTQTLGRGGAVCDFRWRKVQKKS